jgi:hypothetical protein
MMMMNDTVTLSFEEWAQWRKAAGLHIDPETAEVLWKYTQVVDPYGVGAEIAEECDCVGRSYFARSPGMGVWVEFRDLPKATRDALWKKHKSELALTADPGRRGSERMRAANTLKAAAIGRQSQS